MIPSQPIPLRDRLRTAWMLARAVPAVLWICVQFGQGVHTPAGESAVASTAGDHVAWAAGGDHGQPATAAPAPPPRHVAVFCLPCDGEDIASGQVPPSLGAAGLPVHRNASARPSPRGALRWRHRGRAPPRHA